LLPVSQESAGGAEQMLFTLENEMAAAGHRTVVAASQGSRISGELLDTGAPVSALDQYEARESEQTTRIVSFLQATPSRFDLIHDQSGSFWQQAGKCPVPVLATLHLPRPFYCAEWFRDPPPNLFFNCVSESQARTFADLPNFLGVVQNGISLERFPENGEKSASNYVLWLGRICEEKGPHLAIEAARFAEMRLVLAGQVYPFRYHQQYFEREIKPHVTKSAGVEVQCVEGPTFDRKIELLHNARAVLLTSTAEETSSLVAMEAMACGIPVVAFRRGAFPEIVADGLTGFVVDTVAEMANALQRVDQISPADCRRRVEEQFTAERMAREYNDLYRRMLRQVGKRSAA
jgi:glycosyltransferase involved in cell wall biosynthesis